MPEPSYEDIIQDAFSKRLDKSISIPNSTVEHAYMGLKYLFRAADENSVVRIISSEFFENFWLKLKEEIEVFLKGNGKIRIILLNDTVNNFLNNLLKDYNKNIAVSTLSGFSGTIAKIPHFAVVEPRGFRFELSDIEKNNNLVEGIINFGDKKTTEALIAVFDFLSTKSRPLATH